MERRHRDRTIGILMIQSLKKVPECRLTNNVFAIFPEVFLIEHSEAEYILLRTVSIRFLRL